MALAGVLGGSVFVGSTGGTTQPSPPPPGISAGFEAIVQCSQLLLQEAHIFNLGQRGLNPLSLRVPYQPGLVTPAISSAIAPFVRPADFLHGGVFLEVVLQDPAVQALNWPAPSPVGSGPGGGGVAVPAAIVGIPKRTVDFIWNLQLNLFKPDTSAGTASSPAAANLVVGRISVGGIGAGAGAASGTGQGSPSGPVPLPAGYRQTIAQGSAAMTVPAVLLTSASIYQFRLSLSFEGAQPAYSSSDPVMVEFLKTAYAASLLAQAVTPLLNQADIGLSPSVTLAGGLTANQLAAQRAPTLQVHDRLVPDGKGQVLALCVSLGADTGGALDLVRSFLNGSDFAYYVSDKLFVPVLKGLWKANAVRTPLLSDVAVEMPVQQGSNQTGTGRAQIQVNLIDTLLDANLQPSNDPSTGDPLLLVSRQVVQLLALFDPSGNQIQDLGDLGTPAVEPLPLGLLLFDSLPPGTQQNIQPALLQLLAALLLPIYAPVAEPFNLTNVTGYASSPLHALVVRWNLDLPPGPVGGLGQQVGAA